VQFSCYVHAVNYGQVLVQRCWNKILDRNGSSPYSLDAFLSYWKPYIVMLTQLK
jgi:hypothetical protein